MGPPPWPNVEELGPDRRGTQRTVDWGEPNPCGLNIMRIRGQVNFPTIHHLP